MSATVAEAIPIRQTRTTTTDYPAVWPWLSLLRFILASVVVCTHLAGFGNAPIIRRLGEGAFEAIMGFLIISGFSIAHSYRLKPEGFYVRRAWRILPIYYFSILFNLTIAFLIKDPIPSVAIIVANVLLLNGYVTAVSVVGPAWTLAIEAWLYTTAKPLFRVGQKHLTVLVLASFGIYCLYTAGRTAFEWPYYAGTNYGIGWLCLAFPWLAGWKLALASGDEIAGAKRLLGTLVVVNFALLAAIETAHLIKHHSLPQILDWTLSAIPRAILLGLVYYAVTCGTLPLVSRRLKKVFSFLGDISYPLYLLHAGVFVFLKARGVTSLGLMAVAALVVSTAAYYGLDFYSRRRKTT